MGGTSSEKRVARASDLLVELEHPPYQSGNDVGLVGQELDSFEFLKHFPSVGYLILRESNINDRGLRAAAKIETLQAINLNKTAVTDAGISALRRHTSDLRELHVGDTEVTCESLPMFEKLHQVNLAGSALSNAGFRRLVKVGSTHGLGCLSIARTDIGDSHVGKLLNVNAKTIVVSPNQFSDASLDRLTEHFRVIEE